MALKTTVDWPGFRVGPKSAARISETKPNLLKLVRKEDSPSQRRCFFGPCCLFLYFVIAGALPFLLSQIAGHGTALLLPGGNVVIHVPTTLCRDVFLASSDPDVSFYLLRDWPTSKHERTLLIHYTVQIQKGMPQVLTFALNEQANLTVEYSAPTQVNADIIVGQENLDSFLYDGMVDVEFHTLNHGSSEPVHFTYTMGYQQDVIYLVFSTPEHKPVPVDYNIQYFKTEYEVSDPLQTCNSWEGNEDAGASSQGADGDTPGAGAGAGRPWGAAPAWCRFPLAGGSREVTAAAHPTSPLARHDPVAVRYRCAPRPAAYLAWAAAAAGALAAAALGCEARYRRQAAAAAPGGRGGYGAVAAAGRGGPLLTVVAE